MLVTKWFIWGRLFVHLNKKKGILFFISPVVFHYQY